MQLGFDVQIPDGLLAANALLAENSRQGFATGNRAPYQGLNRANCTAALGLSWSVASGTCSTHLMGRWMSPDWSAKPAGVPYSSFSNPQSLNLYGYVGNDPITGEDPDGHLTFGFGDGYNDGDNQNPTVNTNTSTTPASAVAAAANAFGSDMLGGVGRVDQDSPDGKIGAAIGDFGAALLGAGEVAFGTAGEALGTALDATGVGALAGVPINIVSAGVMAEGGATAAEGAVHLAKDAASDGPYKRPNNATTPEQRKSVQGQACATCGATGQKNYAGHKDSLVEQHYRGGIDKNAMRSPGAVRPECAACSNQQGAYLKTFSNAMKSLFGFN